jgi:hypothetical protein
MDTRTPSFPVLAAFPLAVLVAIASLGGIVAPATYAQETASLAAQGIGQDWVNLLVIVPWLVVCAGLAWRGSRRARLLLGGGFAYVAYSYAIYAFGVHFNALFLVYVAALGLAGFALAALVAGLAEDGAARWFAPATPVRFAAGLQIAVAAVFALLWLGDIVPALAAGRAPASVSDDHLLTNPVHVLDLAFALPALVLAGVTLWRRQGLGFVLTPILLGLALLMAVAIGGMVLFVILRGAGGTFVVAGVFGVVAITCGAALAQLLGRVTTGRPLA